MTQMHVLHASVSGFFNFFVYFRGPAFGAPGFGPRLDAPGTRYPL